MNPYNTHALEGASAVDLVVALYDGIIRFLYAAIEAVERGNAEERRAAVKRALDIILHLQARLRMDVGGKPAEVLSEFYASIFAQILQASQAASRQKFEHAIRCVRNVRDAWRQVAREPEAQAAGGRLLTMPLRGQASIDRSGGEPDTVASSDWTA